MQGQFGAQNVSMSYRAFKADWVATPDSIPALWSAAGNVSLPTTFYASWNRATEIVSWKFYSRETESSCSTVLETVMKAGFETSFMAKRTMLWDMRLL